MSQMRNTFTKTLSAVMATSMVVGSPMTVLAEEAEQVPVVDPVEVVENVTEEAERISDMNEGVATVLDAAIEKVDAAQPEVIENNDIITKQLDKKLEKTGDALENIDDGIIALDKLNAEAEDKTAEYNELASDGEELFEIIDGAVDNEQGTLDTAASQTQNNASDAGSAADKAEAASKVTYENEAAANAAKADAANLAKAAQTAADEAAKQMAAADEAMANAKLDVETAQNKLDEVTKAKEEADAAVEAAKEELASLLKANGIDPSANLSYMLKLKGDARVAVENASAAVELAIAKQAEVNVKLVAADKDYLKAAGAANIAANEKRKANEAYEAARKAADDAIENSKKADQAKVDAKKAYEAAAKDVSDKAIVAGILEIRKNEATTVAKEAQKAENAAKAVLDNAKAEQKAASDALDAAKAQKADADKAVETAKGNLEEATKALKAAQDELKKAEKQYDEKTYNRIKKQFDQALKDLEDAQANKAAAEKKVSEAGTKLTTANTNLTEATSAYNTAKTASEEATKNYNDAKDEADAAKIAESEAREAKEAAKNAVDTAELTASTAKDAAEKAQAAFDEVKDDTLENLIDLIKNQQQVVSASKDMDAYWNNANTLAELMIQYKFYQEKIAKPEDIKFGTWERNSKENNYVKVTYKVDGVEYDAYFDYVSYDKDGIDVANSKADPAYVQVVQKAVAYRSESGDVFATKVENEKLVYLLNGEAIPEGVEVTGNAKDGYTLSSTTYVEKEVVDRVAGYYDAAGNAIPEAGFSGKDKKNPKVGETDTTITYDRNTNTYTVVVKTCTKAKTNNGRYGTPAEWSTTTTKYTYKNAVTHTEQEAKTVSTTYTRSEEFINVNGTTKGTNYFNEADFAEGNDEYQQLTLGLKKNIEDANSLSAEADAKLAAAESELKAKEDAYQTALQRLNNAKTPEAIKTLKDIADQKAKDLEEAKKAVKNANTAVNDATKAKKDAENKLAAAEKTLKDKQKAYDDSKAKYDKQSALKKNVEDKKAAEKAAQSKVNTATANLVDAGYKAGVAASNVEIAESKLKKANDKVADKTKLYNKAAFINAGAQSHKTAAVNDYNKAIEALNNAKTAKSNAYDAYVNAANEAKRLAGVMNDKIKAADDAKDAADKAVAKYESKKAVVDEALENLKAAKELKKQADEQYGEVLAAYNAVINAVKKLKKLQAAADVDASKLSALQDEFQILSEKYEDAQKVYASIVEQYDAAVAAANRAKAAANATFAFVTPQSASEASEDSSSATAVVAPVVQLVANNNQAGAVVNTTATRRRANNAAQNVEDNNDGTVQIDDAAVPMGATPVDDDLDAAGKSQRVAKIDDNDVALAALPFPERSSMNWWWAIIVALVGVSGYGITRKVLENKNTEDELNK